MSRFPLSVSILPRLSLALSLALAACGADQPAATQPASPQPAAPAEGTATGTAAAAGDSDLGTLCRQAMSKSRSCTDLYIPALVDARIQVDRPPGIAAQGNTPAGRDHLIEQARTEWQNDSTPEAIDATCSKMVGAVPDDQRDELGSQVATCLDPDHAACDAFVACIIPVERAQLR